MSELDIEVVTYGDQQQAIAAIRRIVFQEEQGVPAALEFDGQDEAAIHLLAYWQGRPVGTARIRQLSPQEAKIERLAVLPGFRRRGIGRHLMERALAWLTAGQCDRALIHAQIYVQELYEQLGFQRVGEPFEEAGIPHLKMVVQLRTAYQDWVV